MTLMQNSGNWWHRKVVLILHFVLPILLISCSGEKTADKDKENKRDAEIQEAIKLSEQMKQSDKLDFEKLQQKIVKNPGNVCRLMADFTFINLGENPDFFYDGSGVVYADSLTNVFYRDFGVDMKKFKLLKGGRNPSWNHSLEKPKVVFEVYKVNPRDLTGINHGISVIDVYGTNDIKSITDLPGVNPRFSHDDSSIVFRLENKYYSIDEKMAVTEITKERYDEIVKVPVNTCDWSVLPSYRDKTGVWLKSADERSYCLVWPATSIDVMFVIPNSCWIYFWSKENAGLLKIQPESIRNFELSLGSKDGIAVGDILDVYEKKLSPLTGETIGYYDNKWKGSLRILTVQDASSTAEYQTRIFREPIIPGDAIVNPSNTAVSGSIANVIEKIPE